jgi:hypothetical protein
VETPSQSPSHQSVGVENRLPDLLTAKHKGEDPNCLDRFCLERFSLLPLRSILDEKKNLQANSLMMWEAIRFGKKLGLKTFDLWGREPGEGFYKI